MAEGRSSTIDVYTLERLHCFSVGDGVELNEKKGVDQGPTALERLGWTVYGAEGTVEMQVCHSLRTV